MDRDAVEDLFSDFGPVTIKRMFGGMGIYADGLIMALVLRGELYLKGDDETSGQLEAAGAERWIYENSKSGNTVAMPYWRAPDDACEDPSAMTPWARLALSAARRFEREKAPKPAARKPAAKKPAAKKPAAKAAASKKAAVQKPAAKTKKAGTSPAKSRVR